MTSPAISSMLLWAASVVSLLGFLAHVFLGRSMFVRPLLANTDLPVEVTWLGYVSWHVVSIVLMGLAIAFGYALTHTGTIALAVFASGMSAAVSVLCIVVGIRGNAVMLKLPAPYLFGFIALLGAAGVLGKGA